MKFRDIKRQFQCPSCVTLMEVELPPPPEVVMAITEGKMLQKIPQEWHRVEIIEPPEILPAKFIDEDDPSIWIEPKRKQLEVSKWLLHVYAPDSLSYKSVIDRLKEECRKRFAYYHRIFLKEIRLQARLERDLAWDLRSKLRYWWLRFAGRPVDFQAFRGWNKVIFTLSIIAAME